MRGLMLNIRPLFDSRSDDSDWDSGEQSLKRKQAEQDARLKGKATTKQSDITISFRPKVNLKTGETVQLKLEGFFTSSLPGSLPPSLPPFLPPSLPPSLPLH